MSVLRFTLSSQARVAGVVFSAPRPGDAGFDIRACVAVAIYPGEQVAVPTGLSIAVPLGFVAIIKDRSSMALKGIYSHAGVIDASYRGEVKVLLSNSGSDPYQINPGDKVAQLVVVQHLSLCEEVESLDELGETERGAGGFGSTGR
jgi:dUTP pyrophosphatase